MFRYKITRGLWKDFFSFELPNLFFTRSKSHAISCSKGYPSSSPLPNSILEFNVYNPTAYPNQKTVKVKLWFDPQKRVQQLHLTDYFKYSDLVFDERERLHEIGAEMKLIVFRDKSYEILFKNPSDYSFDTVLPYLKKKIKNIIPYMNKRLMELLKEEIFQVNDFITLKQEENLFRVYCNEKSFWTFILEDIKRPKPLNFTDLSLNYKDWFLDTYLPHAEDPFKPKTLEFSEVCSMFQDWDKSSLQNLHFTAQFYSRLMRKLIDNDYPSALNIYKEEVQKKEDRIRTASKNRNRSSTKLEGNWNEFFDFTIPAEKKMYPLSNWEGYLHDKEKFIPRSVITLDLYPEQETHEYLENADDVLFVISYYLEKEFEMKEIEFEAYNYYKYGEFLSLKDKILRNLGETIRLITNLDHHTTIIFYDSKFIPRDIVFMDLKVRLKTLIDRTLIKTHKE